MDLKRLAILALVFDLAGCRQQPANEPNKTLVGAPTVDSVVKLSVNSLQKLDIAQVNLCCAQGLPGTTNLNIQECLAAVDQMVERVRTETERHAYRFRQAPAEFENSAGYFKMIMMGVVLAEDFKVQYAPAKRGTAAEARIGDGFFAEGSEVFLHGLLGSKHEGTCSSMPVLYVAVGRKLGYPLSLVTTKGHLFVRWENVSERFNIEVTSHGINRFSDDYYRHWPMEVSEEEIRAEGYLKSLMPGEELAAFLSIRGMCQSEAGQYTAAAVSFDRAATLAPGTRSYARLRDDLRIKAATAK